VTVQSDNAAYYHNKYLQLALPYIGMAANVNVARYIHTETCDGKCLIDAHFAMAMRFVDEYIGEENNAAGPHEVFKALAHRRGIPNSFVQLVSIDRERALARELAYKGVLDKLKTMVKRQNEIKYDMVMKDGELNKDDPFASADVKMTTWLFSKVGEGAVVDARPSAGNALWVGEHLDDDAEEAEDQEEAEEGEDVDAGTEQDPGPPGGLCPPVPAELLNGALQAGAFCATVRLFTSLPKLRHQWRHEAERIGARGRFKHQMI